MIDKDGKVYRGLQAQVAYLTEKVENGGGGSTPTGPTVDKITALDLAVGKAALTYDANNGATAVKQGQIKAGGNTFNVTVEDKLPIVPGNNVTISTTEDGKHLKISAVGGGGGSGVAGVSSFGGKTGAINVGKNLSMNGNVVNADFKPTPVVIETLSDADASSGTLTANQLATLQANTANPLVKRNEYYYLNDKQHTSGALGYTHIGYENGKWYTKNITITISTKGWVKKSSDIPDKTMIPFISLSPTATSYPINGNFSVENATKLIGSPFSVISFTPPGSPVQVPLLLQPSETIHNSYVYSGHDDSYTYTLNATLSATTGNTWLNKSYVITRKAYVAPVITTIDGKSGAFTLGSNLNLKNSVISATDTITTVNGHTGAVNIVAGSNVSVNDVGGTLTISATGGGGGGSTTDTGFSNVRRIEYADSQTSYDPDSGEYLNTTGTSTVYYKDNTSTTVPYVQTLGLMPGNNVTFTEELVGDAWKVKINAAGGGGGGSGSSADGFNNLKAINLTPTTYQGTGSPAGKFTFKGTGVFTLKDNTTGTIQSTTIQLPVDPGDGISFKAKGEGVGASCEIGLTDLAVLDLGSFSSFPITDQTLTDEQAELIEQHKFSFIKFKDSTGWNDALELDVYCVPVDNAPSHGGITYKSITTQGNTYTVGISIERTSGNVFAHKTFSITKAATPKGGTLYQHNISAFAGSAIIVYCTLYTTDSTALNSLTPWQNKFGLNKVAPGGFVYNANKYYSLLYIKADNESIKAWYIDPETQKLVATEAWGTGGKITDTVKEV